MIQSVSECINKAWAGANIFISNVYGYGWILDRWCGGSTNNVMI